MGQDVDEALRSIQTTRDTLERDIDALFGRLPEREVVVARARTYGAAAGGAAVTVGAVALAQRRRSALKARRMEARINAEELARAFSPHSPVESEGGRGGVLAILAALVVVALTVVMRQRGDT